MNYPVVTDLKQWFEASASAALVTRFDWWVGQGDSFPSGVVSTQEVLERISAVRRAIDSVEAMLGHVSLSRSRVKSSLELAQAKANDVWDKDVSDTIKRGSGLEANYKERDALHNLASLDERIKVRELQQIKNAADYAYEVVKTSHRSLDSIRLDLHLLLRAINVEAALESKITPQNTQRV